MYDALDIWWTRRQISNNAANEGFAFEDGKSLAYGLKGTAVPLAARILHAALTLELAYGFSGSAAARTLAREQRGARFDPEVVDAFLTLEKQADFWPTLEHESAQSVILAMQPPTSADRMMADQMEVVCEALADLVDIKTSESWNHSRIVAEVAVGMGSSLSLGGAEQTRLRSCMTLGMWQYLYASWKRGIAARHVNGNIIASIPITRSGC